MGEHYAMAIARVNKFLDYFSPLLPVRGAREASPRIAVQSQPNTLIQKTQQVVHVGVIVAVPDINSIQVDSLFQ
jgi:hypothetical protein